MIETTSGRAFDTQSMARFVVMRRALRSARGWLNLIAQERPPTSHIHTVLAEVDSALAQADRNPEGHDPEEGRGRNDESPVGEADAPERCSEHSIHSSSGRG